MTHQNLRLLLCRMMILFPLSITGVSSMDSIMTIGDLGQIFGTVQQTEWSNRFVYSFLGIPYAEPPIGDLRYRPPVKITSWNKTIDATSYGAACPQSSISYYSEDCLTLNVFVPKRENSSNIVEGKVEEKEGSSLLPVLIFIHGGTFRTGYASLYSANRLLDNDDLILVVPQYRLGFLGLFSLETDEVPGNVQFLDQIMAMKWVQDNIVYFGGDKDRVTLYGHSSGSASVHFHLLSPLTKGLFHQTILQSGSALRTYGVDENPRASGLILADYCGCGNDTNIQNITDCMKELNVEDVINCTNDYLDKNIYDGLTRAIGHMAVVQKAGDEKFLIDNPRELLMRGEFSKLPMLGGVTRHDGSSFFENIYKNILLPNGWQNDTEYVKNQLTGYVLKYLGIKDLTSGIEHTMIKTYLNEEDIGDLAAMAPGLIDICSMISYKSGSYETFKANMNNSETYVYTFDYRVYDPTNRSIYPFDSGSAHGDDTKLLFPRYDYQLENDIDMAKVIVSLWTSFVINGVPKTDDIDWPVMSTPVGPYLVIDSETSLRDNFLDEFITSGATSWSTVILPSIDKSLRIIIVVYASVGYKYFL